MIRASLPLLDRLASVPRRIFTGEGGRGVPHHFHFGPPQIARPRRQVEAESSRCGRPLRIASAAVCAIFRRSVPMTACAVVQAIDELTFELTAAVAVGAHKYSQR